MFKSHAPNVTAAMKQILSPNEKKQKRKKK